MLRPAEWDDRVLLSLAHLLWLCDVLVPKPRMFVDEVAEAWATSGVEAAALRKVLVTFIEANIELPEELG